MLVDCEEEVKAVAEQQAQSVRPKALM